MPDINQPAGALASGPLIEVDIDDLPNGGRSIMLEDPESAVTEFDACASTDTKTTSVNEDTGLPSWEIRNANGQVIAEDKGDGTGPHFYATDKDGNLIGCDGKTIAGGDKDYESKRNELKGLVEIENQLILLDRLNQLGVISGKATVNGKPANLIVGFKSTDGGWIGFGILENGRLRGIDFGPNDSDSWVFDSIYGMYSESEDIKPGSYMVCDIHSAGSTPKGNSHFFEASRIWRYDREEDDYVMNKRILHFVRFILNSAILSVIEKPHGLEKIPGG
jgi:hypothetical protein